MTSKLIHYTHTHTENETPFKPKMFRFVLNKNVHTPHTNCNVQKHLFPHTYIIHLYITQEHIIKQNAPVVVKNLY